MRHFLAVVGSVLVVCALLLFLGGMASAWLEIRREKRAGGPVTRPGWERQHRERRAVGPVEQVLLTVGFPGLAQRVNDRRHARVSG